MKFQKITIHNIASIEDAVIDFEAQPLADSEVFLITGKTGAGKSTILDAICLALYADTPRLDGTKMQGNTKDGEKDVKIDDPRQLMRRNTGEAFVSLTFIGSNRVHYEATWSVARARKKVTGNMQSKDWQLKNLDTNHTLTKDKEIEAEIKAAIGLDFNQFCRTTMLAQGEFTRFLNSKDDEKAEILEKITGVDIYSKIGAKIFAVNGQKEQIWKEAQLLVEGTQTLTEDQIAEKNNALTTLDSQYNELKTTSDIVVSKRDWIKTDNELTTAINKAEEALCIANKTIESEEFKEKEQLIKDWNATIDARNWMIEAQKAEASLKKQKEVLDELADRFVELLGGQKYEEQEAESMNADIKQIDSYLTKEADKAPIYQNAQTIVGHLNTIVNSRLAIQKSQEKIAEEKNSLEKILNPAYDKAKQEAKLAKDLLDKEEANVKADEDAVTALNLSDLRNKRDAAKDLLGKITTAKERLETLTSTKEQYELTRTNLAERFDALEKKKAALEKMIAPIHDAELKMNVRKEDLDKQSDTIHKFASTLRLKLKQGDTCPVCCQKIESELPHEEELAALVDGLKEAYEEAENEHKKLVETKVNHEAEIKTESKAYDRDSKAFNEDKSVINAEQKALEACKACGIETLDGTTLPRLNTLESSTNTTKKDLDDNIKKGETKELEVKKQRKALEAKRKEVEQLSENVQKAEKAVNDCMGRIATADALVKSKKSDIETAEQKAGELIISDSWEIDWKESPKEFEKLLISLTNEYNTKSQNRQTLVGKLDAIRNNIKNVADVITAILKIMPAWNELKLSNVAKVDNLINKANGINASVATSQSQLKIAEEALATNKTKLNAFLAQYVNLNIERLTALNTYTSDNISYEDGLLKKDRETVVAKKTLLDKAKEQKSEHQQKKPEFAEEETLDTLFAQISEYEKQMGEISEKKGAIYQELKTDKENKKRLGTLIEDAERKKVDYIKWSNLNKLIGDATGNKFRKIAQSYVLTSLIHSANSYMKTLSGRYTLKVTPGTFVISLEDAYQGFVSRAASTISGGESFLVSLSLALALSDIGHNLSVDTLFIDEGFDTLSGEPLQNAINTLRSLHTKAGRHVGIISHVEELQERIPVQIQVLQDDNNSSSKIKIVPELNR